MPKTRLEDIYDCLKAAGIEVYLPGQHQGECISSYVVVKPGGVTKYLQLSTNVCYYELLCYTPADFPTLIERFKEEVKSAMLSIGSMVKPSNMETTPFFDEDAKAWMVDITYQNYKKYDSVLFQKLNRDIDNNNDRSDE